MALLADIVQLFVNLGLSKQEAKRAADAAWSEIQDMRAEGSATSETEKALAELPVKPLPPEVPEPK